MSSCGFQCNCHSKIRLIHEIRQCLPHFFIIARMASICPLCFRYQMAMSRTSALAVASGCGCQGNVALVVRPLTEPSSFAAARQKAGKAKHVGFGIVERLAVMRKLPPCRRHIAAVLQAGRCSCCRQVRVRIPAGVSRARGHCHAANCRQRAALPNMLLHHKAVDLVVDVHRTAVHDGDISLWSRPAKASHSIQSEVRLTRDPAIAAIHGAKANPMLSYG